MTLLIIAGHLLVAADQRAAYLDAARSTTELARQAPGCHEFVQAPDPIEPDRIVIYERWESEAELMAFRNSDPDGADAPLPAIVGADVRRYEISHVGPP